MIIKKKKERKKDKQTEQSRKIKNRPKYTEPTNRNERAGDEPKFECMHSLQHNKNHVRYEQQTGRQNVKQAKQACTIICKRKRNEINEQQQIDSQASKQHAKHVKKEKPQKKKNIGKLPQMQ